MAMGVVFITPKGEAKDGDASIIKAAIMAFRYLHYSAISQGHVELAIIEKANRQLAAVFKSELKRDASRLNVSLALAGFLHGRM